MYGLTWEILYAWAGYDFWGGVLALFSTFFAFRASRNSKLAKMAANNAVQSINSIEAVSEMGSLLRVLKEIRWRLDRMDWERISEHCTDAQAIVATLQSSSSVEISEEGSKALAGMATQMAWLSKLSDKALHEDGPIDQVKVKNMLNRNTLKATALQVELKEKALNA